MKGVHRSTSNDIRWTPDWIVTESLKIRVSVVYRITVPVVLESLFKIRFNCKRKVERWHCSHGTWNGGGGALADRRWWGILAGLCCPKPVSVEKFAAPSKICSDALGDRKPMFIESLLQKRSNHVVFSFSYETVPSSHIKMDLSKQRTSRSHRKTALSARTLFLCKQQYFRLILNNYKNDVPFVLSQSLSFSPLIDM